MKVYGDVGSGNCLKVKYVADFLGMNYEWIPIDVLAGGAKSPDHLDRNPMGQIPVLMLDDGRYLAQSNAIMRYLAAGTRLLPTDPFAAAKVDEWLYWEQYSHEPYIAVCRFHMVYLKKTASEREPFRVERGESALALLNNMLGETPWLANGEPSIADIAVVAYSRLADEGGFDLHRYPSVVQWIARVEAHFGITPRE
ncbi:MAG: glutathione S-transferase family protein [Pseudomonadota bacterium]